MKHKKILVGLFGLLVFNLLVFSLTNAFAQKTKNEIRVGCSASVPAAPIWIAKNNGYFKDANLSIKIIKFDSGKASFNNLLNENKIDISAVAQAPVVLKSFTRSDFAIISTISNSDNNLKILVRNDKKIKKPSDLIGKKIGLTKGTSGDFFLEIFLLHNGISSLEVETINTKPSDLAIALSESRLDAICTWEPNIIKAKELLGKKAFIMPSKGIYREDFYLMAKKTFIKNNQAALKKFLGAIEKSEKFINKNKKKAINIFSQQLGLNKDLTALIWPEFNFKLCLNQTILISLEDEARWVVRKGLTNKKEIPNYMNFISMNALEQIKPKAVTIFR